MENDLIRRSDALTEFEKVCNVCVALVARPMCDECSVADTVRTVKHIPAVDAEPVVHGRWVFSENDCMFYCTNCKNGSIRNDYPFCHWCGAVMDGEKVTE